MSDKKQKEAMTKRAKQVLIVGACVLFVILMILSGMGSHWLTMFTVVKPGDTVIVDYTFYDAKGNPVLTTNQELYTQTASKHKTIVYGKQLSMTAGQNLAKSLYPVTFYSSDSGWTGKFAIFSTEYNAIGQMLTGMKAGDQKHIQIPNSSIQQEWPKEMLEQKNVSMEELSEGDILAMGVSDNPEEMVTNSSSIVYTRLGVITSKTAGYVIVDSGFPSVDISITAINPSS
jgi:FKBP-type peptidyl-prolyl cis-trans isomerase 2